MSKGVVRRRSVIDNNTNITAFAFDFGQRDYIENITYAVRRINISQVLYQQIEHLSNTHILQNMLDCTNLWYFSNFQYLFR